MPNTKLTDKYTWEEIFEKYLAASSALIKNPKKYKKWFMSKKSLGVLGDPVLYATCYHIYLRLKHLMDAVIVIVGLEGLGKTTLGAIINSLVDPSFQINRMAFSPLEFIQQLRTGQPGQGLQIDEGALALFSRESMMEGNRNLVKTMMIVRKKSLLVTICIPDFKLIDSFVRNHRALYLFQVPMRGRYKAVFGKGLKWVAQQIKTQELSSIRIHPKYFWHGNFANNLGLVDSAAYEAKKDKHIKDFLNDLEEGIQRSAEFQKQMLYTIPQTAKTLGITKQLTWDMVKAGKIKASRIGRKWMIPESELSRLMKPINENNANELEEIPTQMELIVTK